MNSFVLYYDTFAEEFVKEKDSNLNIPPERYVRYTCSSNVDCDMIIEQYELPDGNRIDFSYSTSLQKYQTRGMLNFQRKHFFELHDVNANSVRLIGFNVPFNRFLEICEQSFGKEDELWLELNKVKENQNQK